MGLSTQALLCQVFEEPLEKKKKRKKRFFFLSPVETRHQPRCATTKKRQRWSSTTDREWSRPDSPATTLPAPSSPPSSDARVTSPSWSAWATRTPTSVTRLSPREVSSP